jgi:hypothetical protein
MQMRKIRLFVGMMGLTTLLACGVAYAGTKQQTGTVSGTAIDVPIDPDSDSCFPAPNGATVCTDYSSYGNFAGKITGGSDFTGQDNNEHDPVAGTGCNIGGNVVPGIASCTLAGGNEQGCAFESVSEAQVVRDNSSGDLLFLTGSAFTLCTDLSSGPPFNFTGSFHRRNWQEHRRYRHQERHAAWTDTNVGRGRPRPCLVRGQLYRDDYDAVTVSAKIPSCGLGSVPPRASPNRNQSLFRRVRRPVPE